MRDIQLINTKPSGPNGVELSVVSSPVAIRALRRALSAPAQGYETLLCRSPRELRRIFKMLLHDFGLEDIGFALYSFRRGGATADFLSHGLMDKTLERGRWGSHRAARIYIQSAAAELASISVSDESRAMLRLAAKGL